MKILFSPSEAKSEIGDAKALNPHSFIFTELYPKRKEIIDEYIHYIHSASLEDLKVFFGTKKESECLKYKNNDILHVKTTQAIKRYTGVAYEYLKFESLSIKSQEFLQNNLIIFSNLFGPLLAKDEIPLYKMKQGSSINEEKTESFYKTHFSQNLDEFLKDEFIIDLRAGFYEKFYTLKQPYVSMKFIKNKKVVSHWAKAYRGLVLRELAKQQPKSKEEFENIQFKNLKIIEIIEKKFKSEYIFEITE